MTVGAQLIAIGWDRVRVGFLRALRGAGYEVRLLEIADVSAAPIGPSVVLINRGLGRSGPASEETPAPY